MQAASIASILKPNRAVMGYALFLAINAASVWGGTFPFLPIGFQTHEVMLGFFLAQSLVFTATYLASTVGAYFFPQRARNFLVKLTVAPYFLGWCCLVAAIYLDGFRLLFAVAGGGLLGLGSAGFYMLWQRLFASKDADEGNRDLVVGTFYAAPLYFSLHLLPQAVTAFLIPLVLLPLFGLCLTLCGRTINADQPMFEDMPREHPQVYRRVMRDYWRSAVSVGVLGLCAGVMRSLAVANPEMGSLVNALSMAALMAAALALIVVWFSRNIRLSVTGMYRIAFPFLITSFALLPLVPSPYGDWLAAAMYAVYSVAIVLTMIQCAQISRDHGINPVFIYGFFGTIVYALHDIGFIGGTFAESATFLGMPPMALVALTAVYLLGIMYFVGAGSFKRTLASVDSIEFIALADPAASASVASRAAVRGEEAAGAGDDAAGTEGAADGSRETAQTVAAEMRAGAGSDAGVVAHAPANAGASASASDVPDRIAAQAQLLRTHYRLSARETEIMELIARGNTVARIAEMLVVSENTVRTHSKRIYTKLDIHKKQELIDLIDTFGI